MRDKLEKSVKSPEKQRFKGLTVLPFHTQICQNPDGHTEKIYKKVCIFQTREVSNLARNQTVSKKKIQKNKPHSQFIFHGRTGFDKFFDFQHLDSMTYTSRHGGYAASSNNSSNGRFSSSNHQNNPQYQTAANSINQYNRNRSLSRPRYNLGSDASSPYRKNT